MVQQILAPLALDRDALLADLTVRIKAWENMAYVAREIDGNPIKADQHLACVDLLKQYARDLREQPITVVRS